MKNIQLFQEFCSPELFKKIYRIPLSHLTTYASEISNLNKEERDEIIYVIGKVSEYRHKEGKIPDHQKEK